MFSIANAIPLSNWAVSVRDSHPYRPPEIETKHLTGMLKSGKRIITSRIVSSFGRYIKTRSGSLYFLDGDPEPGYADWLKNNNIVYDEDSPIKISE